MVESLSMRRKLTPQERKDKMKRKLTEDKALGASVAVFRYVLDPTVAPTVVGQALYGNHWVAAHDGVGLCRWPMMQSDGS